MSKLGFGTFPVGLTAGGMYAFAPTDPDALPVGERYIDPRSGDYATKDSEILRVSSTRQRVINCIINEFGSSMGVRGMKKPKVHNENTARITQAEVKQALSVLTTDGSISIDRVLTGIQFQGIPGRLGISVEYTDLASGKRDRVSA